MAQNFLNLLKPVADTTSNVFDLSRKHVVSSKPGQLIPCLCVETVPKDKIQIDMAALQRTMTLNTAAFVRGKFRYDFFFVPYVQLWHPFNQFVSQRNDQHSTRQLSHNFCPVFSLGRLIQVLRWNQTQEANYTNRDVFGNLSCFDAYRLLDLLGYGNYAYLLDAGEETFDSLLDHLYSVYVNPFRIAAYQHIFYDFYRNKYYDLGDNTASSDADYFTDYLLLFNFDDISCDSFHTSNIGNGTDADKRLLRMFTMRYAPWKKDVFTSALPSQQFGPVSAVDLSGQLAFEDGGNTWLQGTPYVRIPAVIKNGGYDPNGLQAVEPQSSATAFNGKWSIPSAFDVLQLRKAELLQQWKQNTLRAGNMTDDSFRAHYGVAPFYDMDENVRYLGSFESALQINPIESTAASGAIVNGKVGDIAATGTSVTSGKPLTFETDDFGLIMCIAHYDPDIEYRSDMIDKANRLYEQFDFFTKEFQNIGLDTIIGADFSFSRQFDIVDDSRRNAVLGFAPRYWHYKTAVDKCFGEFSHGSFAPWVAPREQFPMSSNQQLQVLSNFYISPNVYDDIFAISSNPRQVTDTFLHNVGFNIKAIRPMSVLGLPEF